MKVSRIFWDTNLFIYLIEDRGVRAKQVAALRQRMIERGDGLLTSALTFGEVLVKPMDTGDTGLMRRYEQAIELSATIVPFDLCAAPKFAEIRQDRLRFKRPTPFSLLVHLWRTRIYSLPTTISQPKRMSGDSLHSAAQARDAVSSCVFDRRCVRCFVWRLPVAPFAYKIEQFADF